MDIRFNSKKNIILIDTSYYIFNRYFATVRWFKQRKEDFEILHEKIIENKEFMVAFIKHFETDMKKIISKFKTVKSNIIFCLDCPRSDIWRNHIYDKYKQTRVKKNNFNSEIFTIFDDYLTNNNYKICKFDNLEADDVVYLIQKKIREKSNIIIITNDNDYLQMYSSNIKIFNMQLKDISLRINFSPNIELLLKIIIGDKSDNIPKIINGIRKDTALKIAQMTEEERVKYLTSINAIDKYSLNKKLIDLNEIPIELINNFNQYYNIIID
jgi:5'-3' exonuclease